MQTAGGLMAFVSQKRVPSHPAGPSPHVSACGFGFQARVQRCLWDAKKNGSVVLDGSNWVPFQPGSLSTPFCSIIFYLAMSGGLWDLIFLSELLNLGHCSESPEL